MIQRPTAFVLTLSLCLVALLSSSCSRRGSSDSGSVTGGASSALTSLRVRPGQLSPPFDPQVLSYTVSAGFLAGALAVLPGVGAPGTTVTVDGQVVEGGEALIPLGDAGRVITVVVTGPDGGQRTYRITVDRESADSFAQGAYVKASNPGAGDVFAHRIAIDGDLLAVGAPGEGSDASGIGGDEFSDGATSSGAVYVFRRAGDGWVQEAYVKASNTDSNDAFGFSVDLEGDRLFVGAPGEDSASVGIDGDQGNGAEDSGAVYVFRRAAGAWTQESYIKASNTGVSDAFGQSLAASRDTLVVGAPLEDSDAVGVHGDEGDDDADNSGAVYVFRLLPAGWVQEAYIKASNTRTNDQFGASVDVDGPRLVVGAPLEDGGTVGINGDDDDDSAWEGGAGFLFGRNDTTWEQLAYIKPSNTDPEDEFGTSVAISGDTLAISSPGESSAAIGVDGDQSDNSADDSGAIYVFRESAAGLVQEAYLKASNTGARDGFGMGVVLQGDALAAGAPGEASGATGIEGNAADDGRQGSGAAYLFRRGAGGWAPELYVKASNTGASDGFGAALALDGDSLVVGAAGEGSAGADQQDDSRPSSGAIYAFR